MGLNNGGLRWVGHQNFQFQVFQMLPNEVSPLQGSGFMGGFYLSLARRGSLQPRL
jgi:hypothetical protein